MTSPANIANERKEYGTTYESMQKFTSLNAP